LRLLPDTETICHKPQEISSFDLELVLCQSCIDVCHWLCLCFQQMVSTGKAGGTQLINECVTENQPRRRPPT
jgi:hypothetical protein